MTVDTHRAARILIVDDNAMNVELTSYVLSADGLEVDAAEDGLAALDRVQANPPDLILLDIQMPGLDGLTLARRLKSDPATRHIVLVAFTAYAMKGDDARMRAAGCDGYLSKPIDVTKLAAQVREMLPPGIGTAIG
ncbi:response regulator [Ideonella azotifigens]|uniref:Response regulator n=1 Tax=Ideonella azotifigens TaxID=513160 RepID=A0ABN1JS82_9BURK|nr:response regulator [Ideonella azotifigens]MCD2340882.1 response regulator [Ideonella azotifigens]